MRFLLGSSAHAGLSLALMALAGFLTLVAGLMAVLLIPATLMVLLSGLPGDSPYAPAIWLWFPVALVLSFKGIVDGIEAVNDPDWRLLARLALVTGAVPFTAPIILWMLGAS